MEQFSQQYTKPVQDNTQSPYRQKQYAKGVLLVIVGLAVLLHNMPSTAYLMPSWIYGPHTLLMAIGIYSGIKNDFRNTAWLILILVGVYLTVQRYTYISTHDLNYIGLPLAIVLVGVYTIFKRRK